MSARALVAALAVAGASVGLSACGSDHQPPDTALRSRRADLAQVAKALMEVREPLALEAAAAREAWPLVDRGLRLRGKARLSHSGLARRNAVIARAAKRAQALRLSLVGEPEALTGAASGLAGLYEAATGLLAHSWPQVAATASAGERKSSQAAFLRANVGTYLIAVYDGHFDLSLIGKSLRRAYARLGGRDAFAGTLSASAVDTLAAAYSPRALRLRPHPWRALVSG